MSEAVLILPNMRGGCATVGNTVHTLFRVTGRGHRQMARGEAKSGVTGAPVATGAIAPWPTGVGPDDNE